MGIWKGFSTWNALHCLRKSGIVEFAYSVSMPNIHTNIIHIYTHTLMCAGTKWRDSVNRTAARSSQRPLCPGKDALYPLVWALLIFILICINYSGSYCTPAVPYITESMRRQVCGELWVQNMALYSSSFRCRTQTRVSKHWWLSKPCPLLLLSFLPVSYDLWSFFACFRCH